MVFLGQKLLYQRIFTEGNDTILIILRHLGQHIAQISFHIRQILLITLRQIHQKNRCIGSLSLAYRHPKQSEKQHDNTKHPNNNLIEFSKWLHGGVAFAVGLGNVHASGKADSSYSAAMAELLISSREFRDEFHELEVSVLDWALSNWSRKAQAEGLIADDSKLPPDWRHTCVTWQQPAERAIDPVKEQSALNSGLRNGTILYREKLGPDWREKVDAFAEEVRYFKDHGLVHPSAMTVSGAVVEQNNNNADDGEEGDE